ncbi:MAG TPA: MBL fold metallo-hydrolase [Candidatus Aerophobetes bacterium]|uniref:MBL fold metallo-hydrolase n=1 Tax=Aerophobetes bacterium TaxID=2030807 RepID=A0A7C1RDR1_UNCAE|nr:MBL fold metallo-hydrolase [Candidatus Aerophobetes bacterium]
MKVKKVVVGIFEVNCYILWDEKDKEAIVVDPGEEGERIIEVIRKDSLKIRSIVNTHTHIDHIGANDFLREKTEAPLLAHSADVFLLQDAELNLSALTGKDRSFGLPDRVLEEGDEIRVGGFSLRILHSPGHTPGSICLYGDNKLFSGDTLFAGGIGRTDLAGGNLKELQKSIKDKILTLPDEVVVYPGHGPSTTVGKERKCNLFISQSDDVLWVP